MTYNPSLAKVKVDPHAKNQGQRSNGSTGECSQQTDTRTHTDATKRIISPAMRSINIEKITKISPADREITVFRAVIKKRKKLTQAKCLAVSWLLMVLDRYIRDVLNTLVMERVGCNIGGQFINVLAYSDDFVYVIQLSRVV